MNKSRSGTKRKSDNQDILQGLSIENDEFVRIDEKLIKRLKSIDSIEPVQEDPPAEHINPFEKCIDFFEALRNGSAITMDHLNKYSTAFHKNKMSVKMADLLGVLPVELLALKHSEMIADNWDYNTKISVTPHVSDQEQAGLCWMHAATNVLRHDLMKKFHLDHKFELSQTYLFFYDKVERCNLFFEYMWQHRDTDIRDPVMKLLSDPDGNGNLLSDGGMYSFFSSLAKKYGMVPRNVYNGSINSRSTETMNKMIMTVLIRMSLKFRDEQNWTRSKFEKYKDTSMKTIYNLLVRFLGEPPKPTDSFDWTFKDVNGDTHVMKNLTPEKYYRIIMPNEDNKVTIIHDPRHPETEFQSSWVEYGLNMQGQVPLNLINLPLDTFKRIIYESIHDDEPVWFACDIHYNFDVENKTWDSKRYDYDNILGTQLEFNKGDMLDTLTSKPAHAMVFNGVDVVKDGEDKVVGYTKWRIMNSWGKNLSEEDELDHGFYRMSDEYFDKYVTMAVVDLKYFEPEDAKKVLDNAKQGKSFTYKFTDAFGCVAFNKCSHCTTKK